jgi:hypothetical protein
VLKVSDKKVSNKLTMNQKRRKTSSGMKSVKSLTFVCLALNLFGSISYISEGALIQPTLSFTTSGSESGKKQPKYHYNIFYSEYSSAHTT